MQFLDVALGVTFIYLVLSLTVTAANEAFASWFKRRALMLRRGVTSLLEDEDLAAKIYEHPLVRSLYHTPIRNGRGQTPGRGTSLLHTVLGGNPGPSYISSRAFATAFLDAIDELHPGGRGADGQSAALRALAVLKRDSRDRQELIKNIEVWFTDSMERVSGAYKRRTQLMSLVFSAIIVIGTNADSVAIAKALWTNPSLRQATVQRAELYAQEQTPPASGTAQPAAPESLKAAMADLAELQLPIGWEVRGAVAERELEFRLIADDASDDWPGPIWSAQGWERWMAALDAHLLGWLLSIMAVSLGAPFWFDTLNRFMAIRGSGKSPQEEPKPPKQVPSPLEPGETSPRQLGV